MSANETNVARKVSEVEIETATGFLGTAPKVYDQSQQSPHKPIGQTCKIVVCRCQPLCIDIIHNDNSEA